MGNLYRQCAEFGRAIQRCAAAAAPPLRLRMAARTAAALFWHGLSSAARTGCWTQLAISSPACVFCLPARPCSYDNVLSIDASHWRSLLNKAVVQVRMRVHASVGGLEHEHTTAAASGMCARTCLAASPSRRRPQPNQTDRTLHCMPRVLQTCTGDKDQATFNLKLALKLSGTPLPAAALGHLLKCPWVLHRIALQSAASHPPRSPPPPPPPLLLQARAACCPRRWTS